MFQMIFVFSIGALFGLYYPEIVEQGLSHFLNFVQNLKS